MKFLSNEQIQESLAGLAPYNNFFSTSFFGIEEATGSDRIHETI